MDKEILKFDYGEWLMNDNDIINLPEQKIRYDKNDYISKFDRAESGTVPINILKFDYSYGYNCRKYFNLCVPDRNTLIFWSGALIHFFDVASNQMKFQRCSTGIGIGHITKNPQESHIAVGENGYDPPIIIYEWPSMEIITILRKGTKMFYSNLTYSPDGKLLVSQGSKPDYSITIWNWMKSVILLRCKSHEQDIHNVIFSPSIPGHLVTSGSGHIKFWKISKTFTGLKLEGELGKFGKTEISDILGLYSMPDEKVISGCEWGNILIWEEGLIKLEVRRKNKRPCHSNMITQFEFYNDDLISIGMDGWIRMWSYETIDQADPPEDNRYIEIEPIHEFKISQKLLEVADIDDIGNEDSFRTTEVAMLMSMKRRDPENMQDHSWYGQDGNGALWLIDLSTFHTEKQRNYEIDNTNENKLQLLRFHAGPIMDMSACTWNTLIATIGADGYLNIYNYIERKLMAVHKFNDRGSAALWLPCSLDKTGSTIICAFKSGVIRLVAINLSEIINHQDNNSLCSTKLIQVLKPHTLEITVITITNNKSTPALLITGSSDSTIFLFSIKIHLDYPKLEPIGFINVPSGITCISWNPNEQLTILIGCIGYFGEIQLSHKNLLRDKNFITYELCHCKWKFYKFHSVKSMHLRKLMQQKIEIEKMKKLEIIRKKMKEYRELNPGFDIDEDTFFMDTEEFPPLPDLYIPEKPNSVLNAHYTSTGNIWLSMSGYDAGYIYEYPSIQHNASVYPSIIEDIEPIQLTLMTDADNLELQSFLSYRDKFIFLGLENGQIRVCRMDENKFIDFSDYLNLPLHDYSYGYVKKILLSHNEKFLFTCGYDGNIFSFLINDDDDVSKTIEFEKISKSYELPKEDIEDIEDINHPNLQKAIMATESDRIMIIAKKHRENIFNILQQLTKDHQKIMERCRILPKSQQIPMNYFRLDERIVDDLNSQLESEIKLVYERLAFKTAKNKLALKKMMDYFVQPITCLPFGVSRILKPNTKIHSVNEKTLTEEFYALYTEICRRIHNAESIEKSIELSPLKICEEKDDYLEIDEKRDIKIDAITSFLKDQMSSTVREKMTVEIKQILRKYKVKKAQIENRNREWAIMYANKPDPNSDHPDDIREVEVAKSTIGDYKLKISKICNVNERKSETTMEKYKQLLDCKKKCHHLRETFNDRLKNIRSKKLSVQNEISDLTEGILKSIHNEIFENNRISLQEMPNIDDSLEYPENNLKMEKYISMAQKVKEARKLKQSIVDEAMQNAIDEEYKTILLNENIVNDYSDMLPISLNISDRKIIKEIELTVPADVRSSLNDIDCTVSSWEREMKSVRMLRKIYEQNCIIKRIENSYQDIDGELDELELDRLKICTDTIYSELYQLTLHQELIILRDFEKIENLLTAKVNENIEERTVALQKLQTTMKNIDKKNRVIKNMQNKIRDLTIVFIDTVHDNKYAKFLTKIFKKKAKFHKIQQEVATDYVASSSQSSDSSDNSSSSTEVDDSDSASGIDIHKIGYNYLDENICPSDCSQELYDLAFSMRSKRYEYENSMRDEQKNIELFLREADQVSKKIKIIENTLKDCQQVLLDFIFEKQCKLNNIDMTLILKFHQLEHIIENDHFSMICNCVVFDTARLSQLYTRVGQLQQDTHNQRIKHQKNRTHLCRMKLDCKYMQAQIKQLKSDMKEEMLKKFGICQVSLSSLYEAVLRRIIHDIKSNITDNTEFDKQLKCLKKTYNEKLLIMENLIKDNTEKLSFLTVLSEEQMKLRKIIKKSPQSMEVMHHYEREWRNDLEKLETLLKNQKQQKEFFRNDVRNLKLKIRFLPPIPSRGKFITSFNQIPNKNEEISQISLHEEMPPQQSGHYRKNSASRKLEDKHDSAFRIVRDLLSKILQQHIEIKDAESIINQFFHEIFDKYTNFPTDFIENLMEICGKIEKKLEEISGTDEKITDTIREIFLEYANEIISQLEIESRGIGICSIDISWNMKPKIEEFLDSMKIKKDILTEIYLMKFLKMENGLELATDYVLTKLSKKHNSESMLALREHALRTLNEIQRHILGESEPENTLLSSNSGP